MRIIVGLGNPGSEYSNTRHNAGFMLLDYLAQLHPACTWQQKFNSLATRITFAGDTIMLIKPQTFMNLSGRSVQSWLQFYKLSSSEVVVAHDDVDLDFGRVKVKLAGGSGGHNGIKSIDQHIGNNYYRLRLGIGRPPNPRIDTADYVLGKFSNDELSALPAWWDKIIAHLPLVLKGDHELFASKINQTSR